MRILGSGAAVVTMALCALLPAQAQEGPAKWLEDFEKKFPPVKKNAAADEVEKLSLVLGIESNARGEEHPSKEELDAYRQAGLGSWLEAQLKTSDDSIAPPPPRLKEFLDGHQAALARLTGLLARETPAWGFDVRNRPERRPELLLIVTLSRVLLAGALVEERIGDHSGADELVRASWSLYKSAASQPDLLSQLIAIAVGQLQAGALRKMQEAPPEWLDRMSGDAPRELILETLQNEPMLSLSVGTDSSSGSFFDAWSRAYRSVADRLRELSPCQLSKLSNEEIWRPGRQELVRWRDAGTVDLEATLEMMMPNLTQALRRSGRLLVDRELTVKILELRQEKAGSRDGRWPVRYFGTTSRVCPEAEFEYQARGAAMSIRFKGPIESPDAPALVLPLSFKARAPRPTPTPTPARTPKAAISRTPHP